MKKTPNLFLRNPPDGDICDIINPKAGWVFEGEGVPTVKYDGTACLWQDGRLWKRYDRKVTKQSRKRGGPFTFSDFKNAPDNWIACEDEPDVYTGHWPGWVPVSEYKPEDKYHCEAVSSALQHQSIQTEGVHTERFIEGQTYELVGPKINGNPELCVIHELWEHGAHILENVPRDFEGLREYLSSVNIEGIVFHHPDGRKAKIRRRDFGLEWPVK